MRFFPLTRRARPVLWVGVLVGASGAARIVAARRLDAPWVAPDEFVYALSGRTFWSTGQLTLFGADAPFYGLYPLLVGLPLQLFGPAAGLLAMQVIQVTAVSSTIVVVYVWARRMTSTGWAVAAAAMTAALPGLAYSGLLMTESLFLASATIALWALSRALVEPTLGRQATMLVAVSVAFAFRLQAMVLVPAVVLAVAVRALSARDRRVLSRLVPTLVALGLAALLGLAAHANGTGSPLGAYETAIRSDYRLGTALTWIFWHAADVALIVVALPLLAALLLLVESVRGREENAEVQSLVAVATSYFLVSVAFVGVFASSNVGHLAERDLISVAPPLFLAFAVWLGRGMPRPQPTALLVALLVATPIVLLPVSDLVTSATPDALMLVPLLKLEEATSTNTLEWVWPLTASALLAVGALAPRRGARVLAVLVVATLATTAVAAQREVRNRTRADRSEVFGSSAPQWIDRKASGRTAYLYAGDPLWTAVWQAAFWNEKITSIVAISGERGYGPVPGNSDADILEDGTLVSHGRRLRGARPVVSPANIHIDGKLLASSSQSPNQSGLALWDATDPLRVTLRVTRLPRGRVTKDPFTAEVFGCNGGTLKARLSARKDATVLIAVEGHGHSTLAVPAGKPIDAEVPLPRRGGRPLCLVRFAPRGEVTVGDISSAPDPRTRRRAEPVSSLRPVGLPDSRFGYCLDGVFLSLAYRQPQFDPSVLGAVMAHFVDGIGLTCDPPPAGFRHRGFAPAGLGVPPGTYSYYSR